MYMTDSWLRGSVTDKIIRQDLEHWCLDHKVINYSGAGPSLILIWLWLEKWYQFLHVVDDFPWSMTWLGLNIIVYNCRASFRWICQSISHCCFQVYYLRGIGKLLQLLTTDNEEVQRVAAGALRNVVYQSDENKMEVKENDGLATILGALKGSRDKATRRELTGEALLASFALLFYWLALLWLV